MNLIMAKDAETVEKSSKKRLVWTDVDCSNLSFDEVKLLHNQYIRTKLSHDPRYQSLVRSTEIERPHSLDTSRQDDRDWNLPAIEQRRTENHGEATQLSMFPAPSVTDHHTVLEWRRWPDGWTYTGTMGLRSVLETQSRPCDRQLFSHGFNPNA